jgi:hypothetical protein
MSISSLEEVLTRLKTKVPNDLALAPVCTRVMLRTGVNLRSPRDDQRADGALIGKVLASLTEMGYTL